MALIFFILNCFLNCLFCLFSNLSACETKPPSDIVKVSKLLRDHLVNCMGTTTNPHCPLP